MHVRVLAKYLLNPRASETVDGVQKSKGSRVLTECNRAPSCECDKAVKYCPSSGTPWVDVHVLTCRHIQATAPEVRVCSFSGGDKRNALAREAGAFLVVPTDAASAVQSAVVRTLEELKGEYGLLEKVRRDLLAGLCQPQPFPCFALLVLCLAKLPR